MKILLVDDHALFRQSLQGLLTSSGYEVVGTASNGLEALQRVRRLRPDLILMDIEMPECDGLAATRLIKAEMPQIKIVMLTVSSSDEDLFEAIKSGACGYLLKSQSAERFLELVAQVERGGAALPPQLAARLLEEFARQARPVEKPVEKVPADLTGRQREILTLVAQGLTYAQIGEALYLSEATIRYHMGRILERLHLENRAQVIAYAARHGLAR
ncbi:MAG: response regulator transcription factor [Anaerolineae bacterium]|nr:response regulator transcription factor [Anaerolineae bacterium]